MQKKFVFAERNVKETVAKIAWDGDSEERGKKKKDNNEHPNKHV